MTALVLAGHGSHITPQTAGLVWTYVDQLRSWGAADEITACFWKETPPFSQVLNTLESTEVIVVPVFTSQGYFSSTVIPAEMQLTGPVTGRGERTIHYTPTIGEHPYVQQIVRQRAEDMLLKHGLRPAETAIAIIGHGTRRDQSSQDAARQQAAFLRSLGLVSDVIVAYLDDEPDIPSIFQRTPAANIIAVPMFLAPGSHVSIDVPAALGIEPGSQHSRAHGRSIYYTEPVGTDESICQIILELARDTGLTLHAATGSSQWQHFPRAGRHQFVEAIQQNGSLEFGQLYLTPNEVKPVTAKPECVTITDPMTLRRWVGEKPFRPLATSDDLPDNWRVPVEHVDWLPAIVETIYPGAIADWAALQAGHFQAESLARVSERQTGMFRGVHHTPIDTIEQVVESICGHCARHATWFHQTSPKGTIPCQSPCNVWLSRVMEAVAI